MLRGSQLQRLGCRRHQPLLQPIARPFAARSSRLPSLVVSNAFGKGKGKSGGGDANKEDAARKALEVGLPPPCC
jgi:hypothetical protein